MRKCILFIPLIVVFLASCGESTHVHTFDKENWTTNSAKHWHKATCEHTDLAIDAGDHIDQNGDFKCDVCDYLMHTHTFSAEWSTNESKHWHVATCGHDAKSDFNDHFDNNNDYFCDTCGFKMGEPPVHVHTFSSNWSTNSDQHWHDSTCGHDVKDAIGNHVDSNKDCYCDVCNYKMGEPPVHQHTFAANWTFNAEEHWHVATCGHDVRDAVDKHVDLDGNYYCDVCDYKMGEPPVHVHIFEESWTTDAQEHWHVATCGHDVVDAKGAHIDNDNDGKCDTCNYIMYSPEIVHVESISLDKEDIELEVGKTSQLTATVLPENAKDKSVTWESSNTDVATVNNGKITAISAGNCVISATTNDLGFVANCDVVVTGKVDPDPDPVIDTAVAHFDAYDYNTTFKTNDSIDGVDLSFTDSFLCAHKANGRNEPVYCIDGKISSIRLYPNNTFELRNRIGNIKTVEFEFETKHDTSTIDILPNVGIYSGDIWEGSSKTILFTIDNAAGGKRAISKLHVTYETKEGPHAPIDLGVKSIKEVKDYITNPEIPNPIAVNSHDCGVDKNVTITIKGFALAKISLIKTAKDFGLNVSEPSKIIMGDDTDAIACATKTGDGSFFDKVSSYQMKDTSRYTVSGYISIYLGQPEIVVTDFKWDQTLDVKLDIERISKENISITEFYEKSCDVYYNCAGHGYGEVYTLKGLTCYYDESAGQGKDWYNFTDGNKNIRVNAYNLGSVSVGSTYDVTGIISLQNLSPIIVAFKISKSDTAAVDLNNFYLDATEQSINDLLKIKGSQTDTDTRYPAVINSYSQISKTTGYMCIVEENEKLYVGFSDAYKGENFIVGKDNAKANYGVTLIKNDGFWNTTEEKLALFNSYYNVMCENIQVTIYFVNRQLGYKQNKPMWEILLIPQSIPAPVAD